MVALCFFISVISVLVFFLLPIKFFSIRKFFFFISVLCTGLMLCTALFIWDAALNSREIFFFFRDYNFFCHILDKINFLDSFFSFSIHLYFFFPNLYLWTTGQFSLFFSIGYIFSVFFPWNIPPLKPEKRLTKYEDEQEKIMKEKEELEVSQKYWDDWMKEQKKYKVKKKRKPRK